MPDLHSVRSLRTLFSVDNNVLLLRAEELMTVSRLGRRPTMEALLGCLTAAAVVLCTPLSSSLRAQSATPLALASPLLAQPPNVGDAKASATAYHDSGAYARDLGRTHTYQCRKSVPCSSSARGEYVGPNPLLAKQPRMSAYAQVIIGLRRF